MVTSSNSCFVNQIVNVDLYAFHFIADYGLHFRLGESYNFFQILLKLPIVFIHHQLDDVAFLALSLQLLAQLLSLFEKLDVSVFEDLCLFGQLIPGFLHLSYLGSQCSDLKCGLLSHLGAELQLSHRGRVILFLDGFFCFKQGNLVVEFQKSILDCIEAIEELFLGLGIKFHGFPHFDATNSVLFKGDHILVNTLVEIGGNDAESQNFPKRIVTFTSNIVNEGVSNVDCFLQVLDFEFLIIQLFAKFGIGLHQFFVLCLVVLQFVVVVVCEQHLKIFVHSQKYSPTKIILSYHLSKINDMLRIYFDYVVVVFPLADCLLLLSGIITLIGKMSLGPHNLNLRQQNIGQLDNGVSSLNSRPMTESQTILSKFDEFVKYIRHYQDMIKEMVKDISHITYDQKDQEQIDIMAFYPRFWIHTRYIDDEEKKVATFSDQQFTSIFRTLQKNNAHLKEELRGYFFEFSKKTLLTETLVNQNKQLRKFVIEVNKNLKSLLVHVNQAQKSEENEGLSTLIEELRHQEEENNILKDHYHTLIEQQTTRKAEETGLVTVIEQKMKTIIQLEARIKQLSDEEQNVGDDAALESSSKKEFQQRERVLNRERERLVALREELGKDRSNLEDESTAYQTSKTFLVDKIRPTLALYQSEHQKTVDEAESVYTEIERQQKKMRELEENIDKNEQKLNQYQIMKRKLQRKENEYSLKLSITEELRLDSFDKEAQHLSKSETLDIQIKELQDKLDERRKQLQQQQKKDQIQLKNLQKLRKDDIQRCKQQLQIRKRANKKRIMNERHGVQMQETEIQILKDQIRDANSYVQHLLDQIRGRRQSYDNAMQIRHKTYSQTQQIPRILISSISSSSQNLNEAKQSYLPNQAYSPRQSQSRTPTNPETMKPEQLYFAGVDSSKQSSKKGRKPGISLNQTRSNPHSNQATQVMESSRPHMPIQLKGKPGTQSPRHLIK